MKKVFLLLIGLMLISNAVFAEGVYIYNSTGTTKSIPVASTNTVYSQWFRIDSGEYACVSYWVWSNSGAASVTIQLQQSPINPDTAGVSDPTMQVPVNMTDIVTSLTTELTWYHQSVSPLAMPYARFKITGTGSNSADTIVMLYVTQEKSLYAR